MTKSKSKFKGLLKGAALGFAFVLSSAFFPVNAISALAADFSGTDEINTNTHRIEVDGEIAANSNSATVSTGGDFTIPVGEYFSSAFPEGHRIGIDSIADSTISVSNVEVFMKYNDTPVEIKGDGESKYFTADRQGTYTIRYTVIDNDVEYSYDFDVESVINDVTFEFEGNDANIIPSVYDKQLATETVTANADWSNDIVLPLPTVIDENDEEVLTKENSDYYRLTKSLPDGDPENINGYVLISLTGGDDSVTLQTGTDTDGQNYYYIDGDALAEVADGTEFKITYSFYQRRTNGSDVFVASTSRTFTVHDDYYYHTSDEDEAGYDLVTSWSGSTPDSAVVGVEVTLPTITATTRSTNTPSSEAVSIYYDVTVTKMDDSGRYTDNDVTDTVIDGNTFKAVEEGSYRIVYTVRDFYGNTVSTSNTTFYITNVRDTQQAQVHMYDAGASDDEKFDSDGNYIDVTYKLKSQSANRNIIMYAIAGTDNMVSADQIELRREIRDASNIARFSITEEKYNDYNLIFAPGTAGGSTNMDEIYLAIARENYEIYKQMLKDDADPSNATSIKTWLQGHNYLLVTNVFNQDAVGGTIVEGLVESDETAIDQMLAQGYAYIKPTTASGGTYEFLEQNYTFYYYANDNMNNNTERSVPYTVNISANVNDNSAPTITFSTDLQTTYLPNDTIEFDVATASDTQDTRIDVLTAYRFLNSSNESIVTDKANQTLSFVIPDNAVVSGNGWFTESKGLVESENWHYDVTASSYSIDLSDLPQGTTKIEILSYAIDDYGNIAFFNRVINVANTQDNDMPELIEITNAPEADLGSHDYTAPTTIALPTLYFTDARPEYMHANVTVYKVTGTGEDTVKRVMQSSNMQTWTDAYRGMFTVNAGTFRASTDGLYQVEVTVTDSSNHTVTTYFSYQVDGTDIIEQPEITNITSEPKEVDPGEPQYLDPPTIAISESDTYGYIGIDSTSDGNTATYYTTTMVSASSSRYDLTQYWFTGNVAGTYKLQYEVSLIRYTVADLLPGGASDANAGIYLEDGKLKYKEAGAEGQSYFVYLERTEDGYVLGMNEYLNGHGVAPSPEESETTAQMIERLLGNSVEVYNLVSDIQTFTVLDVEVELNINEETYEKTQYTTLGSELKIEKPNPIINNGEGQVNREETTVQITCTSGSSTETLATISLANWNEKAVANDNNFVYRDGEIYLKLLNNGQYTIRYSVQGQNYLGENIGDPVTRSYTISNGDVTAPNIEFGDKFIEKETFRLGDTLILNLADVEGLVVNDTVTTDRDALLSTLRVTLENNDTGNTWTLDNLASDGYSYEHELDEAGDYTLTVSVADGANNRNSRSISFTVSTDTSSPVDARDVIGGVLIGLSVAVLAGVVIYFVVSKVKLDKKEKGYKVVSKDKDKDQK